MKTYLDNTTAVNRLLKEYKEYGQLIVAYDFDDTIFDLHEENVVTEPVILLLKRAKAQGHYLCMWTAVSDKWSLTYKKHIAKQLGIETDFFNESISMNDSRKPHFSILLDDRAGLASAFDILERTLNRIDGDKANEERKKTKK